MEDKWALTELPLSYLGTLISCSAHWELLRGALESYTAYAWEADLLELHEAQTITIADELCEEASMDELLSAMQHAIQMRQMEESGELDPQLEATVLAPPPPEEQQQQQHQHHHHQSNSGGGALTLNLSASTQSSRHMLENLVLSEFARKIAAAFLQRKKESRAQAIALELEAELLAEEAERNASAADRQKAAKRRKKKEKAKQKKEMAGAGEKDEQQVASSSSSQQQQQHLLSSSSEADADLAVLQAAELAAREAAAEAARLEALAAEARLAAEEAARRTLEAQRELARQEAREAKLAEKRMRKLARREERAAAAAAAGVSEGTSPALDAAVAPNGDDASAGPSTLSLSAAVDTDVNSAATPASSSAAAAAAASVLVPGLSEEQSVEIGRAHV